MPRLSYTFIGWPLTVYDQGVSGNQPSPKLAYLGLKASYHLKAHDTLQYNTINNIMHSYIHASGKNTDI